VTQKETTVKKTINACVMIASLLPLSFAGCVVGPDFKVPEAPCVNSYTGEEPPSETASAPGPGGTVQRLLSGREIPAEWWTLFRSKELDLLIRRGLARSPTLQAAEAVLREAQENLSARTGTALFPTVDADAGIERQKISGAAFGEPGRSFSPFTLLNASVSVSYALDLFGGARRELESLLSEVDVQRFSLEGARLSLASNIVTAAISEASVRAQVQALREIVSLQEKELEIVERQLKLGAASGTDVLALRAQLAQTRAALPGLERDLNQVRYQLSVLSGDLPAESHRLPAFDLARIDLPSELPVSLPSSLVRQRPDIRAAESLLHAASARIGVATANLYPQITLTGSFGSTAEKPGDLFSGASTVWSLAGNLLQPLFHGGERTARQRAAVAACDQAAAQYRSTVLQAFQNVADVLNALEADARTLRAQAAAEAAARELLEVTGKQLELGAVSHLVLLNARSQYQQAKISLIQAQAARFADTAALFQALGGGWWNREQDKTTSKSQMTDTNQIPDHQ
jgi:NodT family efflux transporter outer membrane factor (OMF) lipoprotein